MTTLTVPLTGPKAAPQVGSKVTIRNDVAGKWKGIVFTFTKMLVVNAELTAPNGKVLRVPPHYLVQAPEQKPVAGTLAGSAQQLQEPVMLKEGQTVVFKEPTKTGKNAGKQDGIFVVVKVNYQTQKVNLVPLGGDGTHWITYAFRVRVINVAKLATALLAAEL